MVGLPEDTRTRELLEWAAEDVLAAGGDAVLWRAHTLAGADECSVAQAMVDARAEEYRAIIAVAEAALAASTAEAPRVLRKLRRELQVVKRRDYSPPAEREAATQALARLATAAAGTAGVGSAARAQP